MKIARIGESGKERPALIENSDVIYLDSVIGDWSRPELESGALEKVARCDKSVLPREILGKARIGSPIKNPTKVICVGLNYLGHIKESNAQTPAEPIIFMKAPETVIGPNDDVVVPPNSEATEFNPLGPCIVTPDEIDGSNLRLWCSVDGEMRQDSNTNDLLFGINHIIWYVSQFMELNSGDIINTGTPFGVGLGFKPPKYLRDGNTLRTGIEGIGEMESRIVAYSKVVQA